MAPKPPDGPNVLHLLNYKDYWNLLEDLADKQNNQLHPLRSPIPNHNIFQESEN